MCAVARGWRGDALRARDTQHPKLGVVKRRTRVTRRVTRVHPTRRPRTPPRGRGRPHSPPRASTGQRSTSSVKGPLQGASPLRPWLVVRVVGTQTLKSEISRRAHLGNGQEIDKMKLAGRTPQTSHATECGQRVSSSISSPFPRWACRKRRPCPNYSHKYFSKFDSKLVCARSAENLPV